MSFGKKSILKDFLELESTIECSLCNEYFDDDDRLPKVLSCGHHFCLHCLKNLLRKNSFIACPQCRRVCKIFTWYSVPTHFVVQSLTEKYKSYFENEEVVDENEDSYCECGEHFEEGNFNFCKVCDLAVCDRCAWKKHKVHFNDVQDCKTFFTKLRDEVESSSERSGEILVSLRSELEKTQRRLTFFAEQSKTLSESVKQLFEDLRSVLNQQEENVLSAIKEHEEEKIDQISTREEIIESEISRLKQALSLKEKIIDKADNIDLIPMRCMIRDELGNLSKFDLVDIPDLICRQKVLFTQSESVVEMIKKVPVGKIKFVDLDVLQISSSVNIPIQPTRSENTKQLNSKFDRKQERRKRQEKKRKGKERKKNYSWKGIL